MGRWCGKTWLEFAPRRGRATASSGRTTFLRTCLVLPGLASSGHSDLDTSDADRQEAGVALVVIRRQRSFNFSCRDCVTVLQGRHTTLSRYLAHISS